MNLIDQIAKTTDEELAARVDSAKSEVIAETQKTEEFDSEALLNASYRVAQAEVRVAVYMRVRGIVANESATKEEKKSALMDFIVRALAEGADDDWSGRMNDFRRVKYDARRATLRRILDVIAYDPEWQAGA
jgi:hypothetical protein